MNVRLPFTPAQREELERQTMIYKYMMSSAPVPPHLLVPIAKNPSNVAHLYPNCKSFCSSFLFIFWSFLTMLCSFVLKNIPFLFPVLLVLCF